MLYLYTNGFNTQISTSVLLYVNDNIMTNRLSIDVLFSIFDVLSNVCSFATFVLKLILKKCICIVIFKNKLSYYNKKKKI